MEQQITVEKQGYLEAVNRILQVTYPGYCPRCGNELRTDYFPFPFCLICGYVDYPIEQEPVSPELSEFAFRGVKGGRKPKALPEEDIKEWAREGMSQEAIATRLQKEYGIYVHRSTICRRLSGKGN